jgi:general secretion pathway protein K
VFYAKLAPFVTVLPRVTKLNVNTASDVVLASLSDDIDLPMAQSLIEQRAGADFPNIDMAFRGLVPAQLLRRIDGVTEFFMLTATVTLGTNQLTMRSILQRDASGVTRAIYRTLGVE